MGLGYPSKLIPAPPGVLTQADADDRYAPADRFGAVMAGFIGQVPTNATKYLYPGGVVATASATVIKIRIRTARIFHGISIRSSAAPGLALTDTWTVQKNGTDTGLVVTLSGAAQVKNDAAADVSFAAGDDLSIKQVSAALSGTTDPIVVVD